MIVVVTCTLITQASVASGSEELTKVKALLESEILVRKGAEKEISNLRSQLMQRERSEVRHVCLIVYIVCVIFHFKSVLLITSLPVN